MPGRSLCVAQVTPVYPPVRGGMGRVAQEYATGLRHLGHTVRVFTPRYGDVPHTGEDVERLAAPLRLGNAAMVPSLGWRLAGFDIVHLHYPFFGGAAFVLLRKLLAPRQKLVVSYVMDAVASGIRGAFFRAHERFELPQMLTHADRVLVSSLDYAQASAMRSWPDTLANVDVHPFGVDPTRFRPGIEPDLRARLGIDGDTPVMLFVSALDPAHHFKGLDVLLDTLASLREQPWRLVIVGDGSLRRHYEDVAARHQLSGRVHFAGDVSDEDLPRYYRVADLHLFPSTGAGEAFGLVCLEAAATGIPTIASALPGVRTVVLDTETGLHVAPRDSGALSDAIRRLLDQPDLRRRLGAAARHRAETHFGWETRVAELERTYFEVLDGTGRRITV